MPDFVSLTCPGCGTRLTVPNEIERFACGSCGIELVVRRGGGIVSLAPAPTPELPAVPQEVLDGTAVELAVHRLQDEIPLLEKQVRSLTPEKGRGFSTPLFIIASMGLLVSIFLLLFHDLLLYSILGLAASGVIFFFGEKLLRKEDQKYRDKLDQFNQTEEVVRLNQKKQELAVYREKLRLFRSKATSE